MCVDLVGREVVTVVWPIGHGWCAGSVVGFDIVGEAKVVAIGVKVEGLSRVSLQMSARKERDKRKDNCGKRGRKEKKKK